MVRIDALGNSALDREINIRIRPRSLLKSAVFLLIVGLSFFLGRWTVEPVSLDSAAVVEEAEEVEVELAEPEAEEEEQSFFAGLMETWFGSEGEEETLAPAVVAEPNATGTTNSSAAPVSNATNASSESVPEEPIITTYAKVAVAVNDFDVDWKETWGKITKIDYTIRNNEEGTIKPDHLGMLVEGYEDFEKKIPLPLSSKTIKSKEVASSKVQVPQGFSYSEITAGSLDTVEITILLYDSGDKVMASFKSSYDLSG